MKLTVWDPFFVAGAFPGSGSRMVEWCMSPGRPPLRLCPVQSGIFLSVGWTE